MHRFTHRHMTAGLATMGLLACQAPTDPDFGPQASLNQGNGVTQSVTGSVHHETWAGTYRSTAINAIKKGNGAVSGKVEVRSAATGSRIHSTINCLKVVGNRAYVSGVVTQYAYGTNDPAGPDFTGWSYLWVVEDNGKGSTRSAQADATVGGFADPGGFGTFPGDPNICQEDWIVEILDWYIDNLPMVAVSGNITIRGG